MKPVLPPLNALRAFEAAGRLGSFKEAAAELHVTPGAVSQHVRLLEEWLGTSLFERHNRRVQLTSAAKAYLEEVGPLFEQLSQATARYGIPRTVSRTLTVNAPATFTRFCSIQAWFEPQPMISLVQKSRPPLSGVRLRKS